MNLLFLQAVLRQQAQQRPALQSRRRHVVRQQADTHAGFGGAGHGFGDIHLERLAGADHLFDAVADEVPVVGEHRIEQPQAAVVMQIGRPSRHAMPLEIARCGADDVKHRPEPLGDQFRVGQVTRQGDDHVSPASSRSGWRWDRLRSRLTSG